MLEPQIVEKPALTIVGLEGSFIHSLSPQATNLKVIGSLWDRFWPRMKDVSQRVDDTMFGIIYGRPENERSHPHELQYIAGVAASSTSDIPQGMVHWTVPAGTFAVFIHRGPISNIGSTVSEIYREWLPQSNYQHAEIADVELYDHRFCAGGEDSEMEYWISVTPKVLMA